jgi:hypothetical protein
MSPADIIDLLSFAAAYDQRTVGKGDVAAWHQALFKLDLEEAQIAVIEHYRVSRERIMPADIWNRCRPASSRLPSAAALPQRKEPADPQRWHREWEEKLAAAKEICRIRREAVLSRPEIARRLCEPPLDYSHADQWNGYLPPETFNGERNNSPRFAALAAICADAGVP